MDQRLRNPRADEQQSWTDWTERLELSGFLETLQSKRLREPHDALTSRARLRLELGADLGPAYGFVSADAERNWKLSSETGIEAREVWLEHDGDGWDVRVGRQIVIWGKADGAQITDIVSPPDYTESVTRDLDEIRMPVDAVKFRLLGKCFDTELIWIPVFEPAVLPTGDNPWAVSRPWSDFVFRGEAAYFRGRYFEPEKREFFSRETPRLLGISLLLTVTVLAVSLRSVRGVVFPLIAAVCGMVMV